MFALRPDWGKRVGLPLRPVFGGRSALRPYLGRSEYLRRIWSGNLILAS